MLGKKNKNLRVFAPITGMCVKLKDVNDNVFSEKILGDGVAIIPEGFEVLAPFDGKVVQIAHTKHALVIEKDEIEVLIHIGIDTVSLEGQGFTLFKNEGERVKKGEKIMEFDKELILSKGFSTMCPIILTSSEKGYDIKSYLGECISAHTMIMKVDKL